MNEPMDSARPTSRRARFAPGLLAAALAVGIAPSRGDACYDVHEVAVGRVRVIHAVGNEGGGWDLGTAASMALRARQLGAVLAAGDRVAIADDYAEGHRTLEFCETPRRACVRREVTAVDDGAVLEIVARLAGASRARLDAARRMALRPVYTVQVFASARWDGARAVADRVDQLAATPGGGRWFRGFYDAYGVPAMSHTGHVAAVPVPGRGTVFRVLVGAFLRRDAAEAVRATIARRTGLVGFVRTG
jgi:hypothetical protein